MRISVGLSGFAYKEWRGGFYPADLPDDGMLAFYATQFPAVEINSTFYRMPSERLLLDWASKVPEGFLFAIKASRRITHNHRLADVADLMDYLVRNVAVLGGRRGPLLFQLPPNMKLDLDRLRAFLPLLPPGWRVALECRHASWHDDKVFSLLREHEVCLVISDQEDATTPLVATAPWGYARLHRAGYTDFELREWAARIAGLEWSDCMVFFKHEEDIAGPEIARSFAGLTAG